MKSNIVVKHKCDSVYCCKTVTVKKTKVKKTLNDKKKNWLTW